MDNKTISELVPANQVTPTDLFVLEQSGTAKKLTGQTLKNWLLSIIGGNGDNGDPGNETKQKYGKLIVFGDSLGEGTSNNDYSFVDILGESGEFSSVVKACRNSATIGPYSADYAVGYDLISQIERYASDVADADIIMCEYQFNDIYAIIAGAVTMGYKTDAATDTTVCGYMKKALNRIRELNPTAHITWVLSGKYDFNRALFGNDMVDLLLLFEATALTLARNYSVGIISIMEESFGEGLVSTDGLHPNTAGHERIAQIILNNLYGNSDIILPERTLMLTGDLSRPETMSIDGSIINIMQMLVAGIRVRMVYDGGDGAIMFDATLAGPDGLVLNATAGNLGSYTILWSMDGSIEFMYDSNSGGGSSGGTVSWNDLTDKPFGQYVHYEWDAETVYTDVILPPPEGWDMPIVQIAKISNDAPEPAFFNGKAVIDIGIHKGEEHETITMLPDDDYEYIADGLYTLYSAGCFMICTVDSVTVNGFTFTKGIWCADESGQESPTINIKVATLVTMDERFIPDTIARIADVKDMIEDYLGRIENGLY